MGFSLGTAITYCIVLVLFVSTGHVAGCYKAIVSFGDSLTDTGNLIRMSQSSNGYVMSAVLPYGETFFHHPTGRYSDGRLIIDFMALSMGLPFVEPYFGGKTNGNRSFAKGVNFAVAGATAMDISFFTERGITNRCTNASLGTELEWFKQMMMSSFCETPSRCKQYLGSSIVIMGEIGGNDYNYAFLQGYPREKIVSFVPKIIAIIASAVREVIEYGAQRIIVPGNFPIGCSSSYLTYFMTANASEYDPKTSCLNWLNDFSEYHNRLLQNKLDRLRKQYPNTTIIYADYYNAAMRLYNSPSKYGFNNTVVACCGGGGPYNYDRLVDCGSASSTVCDNPSSYISWDGSHLTEAAYKWIADGLLKGLYTTPQINGECIFRSPKTKLSDS